MAPKVEKVKSEQTDLYKLVSLLVKAYFSMYKAYHAADTPEFVEQSAKVLGPHVSMPLTRRLLTVVAEALDCADDGLRFYLVKNLAVRGSKKATTLTLNYLEQEGKLVLPKELHTMLTNLAGIISHALCEIAFTGKSPDYTPYLMLLALIHGVLLFTQNHSTELFSYVSTDKLLRFSVGSNEEFLNMREANDVEPATVVTQRLAR